MPSLMWTLRVVRLLYAIAESCRVELRPIDLDLAMDSTGKETKILETFLTPSQLDQHGCRVNHRPQLDLHWY